MRGWRILVAVLAVLPLATIAIYPAFAEVHGSCSHCGRLMVVHEHGAGYARHWKGCCCLCDLRHVLDRLQEIESVPDGEEPLTESPRDTLDRVRGDELAYGDYRYVLFEDGTMIDMRHFLYATKLADDFGEVLTNVGGWVYEVFQWANDEPSGQPLGGNEDLASNLNGADFGDEVFDGGSGSLGDQMVDYLEGEHGDIVDHWPALPPAGEEPPDGIWPPRPNGD